MSAQTIYFKLVAAGMSPVGACAMLGNMQAESGLRSNNAQDGLSPLSDPVYTDYANRGLIDFASDEIGYGLCQWTLKSRKRKMLDFHRQRGKSIDHEDTQVDFCIWELQNEPEYKELWIYLRNATGVEEAADRICRIYERPQVNNYQPRRDAANGFYMTFGGIEGSGYPSDSKADSYPDKGSQGEETYWPPRVLALGMFGPDVVALQGLLIAHGFPAGISGTFDNATRIKTMGFQVEHDLYGDGIVGPLTWAALTKR